MPHNYHILSFVAVTSAKPQDKHIAKVPASAAPSILSNLVANPTYGEVELVANGTDMESTLRYMKNPLYGDRENPMYGTNHTPTNEMYSVPPGALKAAEEGGGGIYSVPSGEAGDEYGTTGNGSGTGSATVQSDIYATVGE